MYAYQFSANTGFLWKQLPFLERIQRAKANHFDALEFHDEAQHEDRTKLKETLAEVDLPIMSLNTRIEETSGCAAIPRMQEQAKKDIDHAIELASDIGARAIHVLSGKTDAPDAQHVYQENLRYALDSFDKTILIEPICVEKNPGYFMCNIDLAARVLEQVNHPCLKIMFDCFHIEQTHGSVLAQFKKHRDNIGHVQIASFPARSEPFPGVLDYSSLLAGFCESGYTGAFGCEYSPAANVEAGLAWRDVFLT